MVLDILDIFAKLFTHIDVDSCESRAVDKVDILETVGNCRNCRKISKLSELSELSDALSGHLTVADHGARGSTVGHCRGLSDCRTVGTVGLSDNCRALSESTVGLSDRGSEWLLRYLTGNTRLSPVCYN